MLELARNRNESNLMHVSISVKLKKRLAKEVEKSIKTSVSKLKSDKLFTLLVNPVLCPSDSVGALSN